MNEVTGERIYTLGNIDTIVNKVWLMEEEEREYTLSYLPCVIVMDKLRRKEEGEDDSERSGDKNRERGER